MTQTSFNDFEESDDGGAELKHSVKAEAMYTGRSVLEKAVSEGPENADPTDRFACPWCLTPREDLNVRKAEDAKHPDDISESRSPYVVSCPNCEAAIPEYVDWFLAGLKVCLNDDLSQA